MSRKANVDERAVIERYEECETARVVAQELNVSTETIYRILKRNGIQRTHRHPEPVRNKWLSNCRSMFCPALIIMLRTVLDMNTSDIASLVGCHLSTVSNIMARRGFQKKKPVSKKDVDIDAIELKYISGASQYELAEEYGVCRETIGKWMRERGHIRGKSYGKQGINSCHQEQKRKAIDRDRERLRKEGGNIELVEYGGNRSTYKCCKCGAVFTRGRSYKSKVSCPECYKKEVAAQKALNALRKEKEREQIKQAHVEEFEKDKVCKLCGRVFHSESKKTKYCSKKCAKKAMRKNQRHIYDYGNHRKRARKYGVEYEPGISLRRLIDRDGLTCKICGGICNLDDLHDSHIGKTYPTIDHITAMKNGGGHTWDNVQIAHMICNSYKRDLPKDGLTEEVIAHAKEQAITNKCA